MMNNFLQLIAWIFILPLPFWLVINHRRKLGKPYYWLLCIPVFTLAGVIIFIVGSLAESFILSHITIFLLTIFSGQFLIAFLYYKMARIQDEKSS